MGGPTGLFTVYDGQTLRRGEFTFSVAYSNFDRDPGNADFVEVPVSFQIGLSDHLELFFNTDAYRAIKVNSPDNLSGFYLPNSRLRRPTTAIGTGNQGGVALVSPAAIILAPRGAGTSQFANAAIFRPQGQQPFLQYPYVGGGIGNFGLSFPSGPIFGFPAGTFPTLGPPREGGNGADLFPGIGSPVGGILPGLVLQTVCTAPTTAGCNALTQAPTVFTLAPSYLPDAPFLNRTYGESSFNTFTAGGKWRWTGPSNPVGVGLIAYYRWYTDKPDDLSGWNQLQRGASPGGNWGDIGVVLFGDARLRTWLNVSANVGYNWNSSVKGEFPNGEFTLLDRPDELLAGVAVDFPVNRYFQPILEFRSTQYVGGRTPNAFENSPIEGLGGFRWFPARWLGMGFAYRHHFNQQDREFVENSDISGNVSVVGNVPGGTINSNIFTNTGGIRGFVPSSDPHGFIIQGFIGRRNKRGVTPPVNRPPDVTVLALDRTSVALPCPPGTFPPEGTTCPEPTVRVTTTAVDPENDVLTYNYTVSGGRIVGQGANVTWDLSGVRPGTYTIVAGADDGCGVCGKTETRTIEVTECPGCRTPIPPCVCPTVSISGPTSVVEPGAPMTFTVNVSGGTAENITYNWTVSAGTIESGQGTPTITVSTTGLQDTNVTATVNIDGTGLCTECGRTFTETGSVGRPPLVPPFDTFGRLQNDEVRGRLDQYFVALRNDPAASGYILIDAPDREFNRLRTLILNHARLRRFPTDRITIEQGDATATEPTTRLYVIPAGRTQADIQR
ncbi:MAG: Ig-like domain-containing protein [Acidobacteriota bacterium]|nr:Ig-like domain-containing protein [Acidobacteriota bacterium]